MTFLDAHLHSTFSDGQLTLEQIVQIANKKQIDIGVADHVGSMYPLNTDDKIINYLDELAKYPVKRSMELNINENFPISEAVMDKLDYRVGGIHFHGKQLVGLEEISTDNIKQFMDTIIELMIAAMEAGRIDILSHPTCLPRAIEHQAPELFTTDMCDKIIATAVKNNVALEINNLFKVPHVEFVEKAFRRDARFSLGSDGHTREAMCDLNYPRKIIWKLDLPAEVIMGA